MTQSHLLVILLLCLGLYLLTEGKVLCFRKLKRGNKCAGIIRKISFEDGEDCCAKKGSGFAIQKQKIGKNRFKCVPCSDINKHPFERPEPKIKDDLNEQYQRVALRPKVQWGTWSPCSASCGAGWRSRYKVCDNCDRNDYENVQSRPCMVNFYCPVDGNWGPWFPWHPCSSSCGGGTRIRQRKCNYPPPAYNGNNCEGLAEEDDECNVDECPVDGGWSEWTDFSPCSESCGIGLMRKNRRCDNPPPVGGGKQCVGPSVTTKRCELVKCPQDGGFSLWSNWGQCDVTCGGGYKARTRACDSPPPLYGGQDCDGERKQLKKCNAERQCPVDGGWSEWTNFGFCRAPKCGKGFQFRSRSCDEPRPQHGGIPCDGSAFERIECFNDQRCPINGSWCDWGEWSVCSESCKANDSIQSKQRRCACPQPKFGGKDCEGEHLKVRKCKECEATEKENLGPTAVIQLQVASKSCNDDGEGSGQSDGECGDEELSEEVDHKEQTGTEREVDRSEIPNSTEPPEFIP